MVRYKVVLFHGKTAQEEGFSDMEFRLRRLEKTRGKQYARDFATEYIRDGKPANDRETGMQQAADRYLFGDLF